MAYGISEKSIIGSGNIMAIDPITAGLELGGKILDKLFPNPEERAALQVKLIELQQSGELAQIEVNKIEAANENLFVSGWRPFIGWVCGIAFAYHLVFQPLLSFLLANAGHQTALPVFDRAMLTDTLFGMLGFGSLRTVEKMANKGSLPWQK